MPTAKAPITAPGIEPSPPSTAAAKTDSRIRAPASGSIEVSTASSTPPTPESPAPRNSVVMATTCGSMPLSRARSTLSATARIALPKRVKRRKAKTAAMTRAASTMFSICCGPTRRSRNLRSGFSGRS
jgi:hypothetical protein